MRVENVHIYGLNESIRASKFPMATDTNKCDSEITKRTIALGRAERGSGHDNFLKGIVVQFDLTFTIKAWTEAERYHWFDIISSQSTMHCITKFDIEKQCNSRVDERIIAILKEKAERYKHLVECDPDAAKEAYLDVLYNVPVGFELTARITTNYQQLKTIYYQRKDHRLPEWKEFCHWVEELPEFKNLVLGW